MAYDANKPTILKNLKDVVSRIKDLIPTAVSSLQNDAKFQTESQVASAIQSAIAAERHASFKKADAVPSPDTAKENVFYLVMNSKTKHYDIYALVSGKMELLDDTTVDLSGYVEKEADKGLSTEDYTTEDKAKVARLDFATDAEVAEMLNEVF